MGRFLEHSRVYYFHAQGEDRVYLSSADWMHRNLLRRVEVCVPIQDHDLKARLIHETFDLPLPDSPCWQLRSDGTYVMNPNQGEDAVHSQDALLKHLSIQI